MKFIAHRGNINGKNPSRENKPEYIERALKYGYDCEIDVWYINGEWILSHDNPYDEKAKSFSHKVNFEFLGKKNLWLHCKNIEAMINLYATNYNYFWHENDKYTITSRGHIWCFPDQPAPALTIKKSINDLYENGMSFLHNMPRTRQTIGVLPELNETDIYQYDAICTDVIKKYEPEVQDEQLELKIHEYKTGTI